MQLAIEPPGALLAAYFADSYVTPLLDICEGEARFTIGIVKFLSPHSGRPLRTKRRDHTGHLVEADSIASSVRASAGSIFNPAIGNDIGHNVGDLADAEILIIAARR